MDVRVAAAKVIAATLREQASLATLIPEYQSKVKARDRALLQELCFGTLRHFPKLEAILGKLLAKPFKAKDTDVLAALACALYQLNETRIPPHAAIGESVQATVGLKKIWAKGLVNGVLRRYQREQQDILHSLAGNPAVATAHPKWLRDAIQTAWPNQAASIFAANNDRAPMTLRINRLQTDREGYTKLLEQADIGYKPSKIAPDAIILDAPMDVSSLPHFADGWVSIQDEAAQLSGHLLDVSSGQRVLDACSAPGGKTCHLLEQCDDLQLTALDIDEERLQRVQENLDRLHLSARLMACDAADTNNWWDGQQFDRILLDAPCSATGVIRRHPDIKVLRRHEDIVKLAKIQANLLDALWPLLKPGGKLLYATCSVLPTENSDAVSAFLDRQHDASEQPLPDHFGMAAQHGRQLLPQIGGHDGFYYALLIKSEPKAC